MKPSRLTCFLSLSAVLALPASADDAKDTAPAAKAEPAPEKKIPAPEKFANSTPTPTGYNLPVTSRLHVTKRVYDLVTKTGGPSAEAEMKNYEDPIPRSKNAKLKMVAIKGGEFMLGTPESEPHRQDHEGPQVKVQIEPFWIGETEIPWALYQAFYQNGIARDKDGTLLGDGQAFKSTVKGKEKKKAQEDAEKLARGDMKNLVDVITQPTPQYHDMFQSGDHANAPEYPAMTMTHHAASKFCKWLSAQTGHFYRLPTEAEWEYACRAGTTTAYHFGDDFSKIEDYAWHGGTKAKNDKKKPILSSNSEFTYHPIGQKKPNPWGLYDMHGNVAEWVLDGFDEGYRSSLKNGVLNPWKIAVNRYPRIVKGGSWYDYIEDARVGSRLMSEKIWKDWDPQVPKSIWYHTDGQHIGFRVVRPLKTPSVEEMHLYWNTDWWEPKRNAEDL